MIVMGETQRFVMIDPMDIKGRIQHQHDAWLLLKGPYHIEKFVLQFGRVGQSAPYIGERGTMKECFSNAALLAIKTGLLYVEGFACRADLPLIIHHGWVENKAGQVFDPTWDDPEDCAYMGVNFDANRALQIMVKQECYGLFDIGIGINMAFIETETTKRLKA